eukprot:CAMPEP_0194357626 /NCGR_PEP_ID=MMETSP0174-20130528/5087_1 /TAXON_ID=216777 /ORGANISM="Proboscia alata, Strain PI-D3" /LENGTH=453 /DNA_ID=CAMNT_0039127735 /DNA_START=340 /DNA_END=1698 /DNA_ORIENTATION=+
MPLDNGDEFLAYIKPDVNNFYKLSGEESELMVAQKMSFQGLAGKFFNLSNERLRLYWEGGRGNGVFIAQCDAFNACGTATFPGHVFYFAPDNERQSSQILHRFHVQSNQCRYVFDPYKDGVSLTKDATHRYKKGISSLSQDQLDLYYTQREDIDFASQYKAFTGIDWLSLYPKRKRPSHQMWTADYFGQQHSVTTSETHFKETPPDDMLGKISNAKKLRHVDTNATRALENYRAKDYLNLTLTVLSCAPRVFEIKNFLSQVEVDHVIHLATGMKLMDSTVSGSDGAKGRQSSSTRTSKNTWVDRSRSPIIDSIYRRASDLLRIDEALLRSRGEDEVPSVKSKSSIAEALQLVHYDIGEENTAHHDFGYPRSTARGQPARFATLLLYLNEGMKGGETTFPRWVNAENRQALKVVPEIGKAVLFYSQLPDGNMDDLSQHSAAPVKVGEKWMTNLW